MTIEHLRELAKICIEQSQRLDTSLPNWVDRDIAEKLNAIYSFVRRELNRRVPVDPDSED